MIVVIDVNVLLSALIRDSTTREFIVTAGQDFCFPEPSLHKIRKYKELILEKSGLSELEFLVILHTLFRFVRLVPLEEVLRNWDEAKEIMEQIDPEDATFLATALGQTNAVIWSDDKHFEKQNRIITIKTEQMIHLFGHHQST